MPLERALLLFLADVTKPHGVTQGKGVLDADVLLRYTSADVAVLFDDLSRAELDELLSADDAALDKAAGHKKTERKYMAKLLQTARRRNREVHPYGLTTHDIFDLLDDAAIRDVFPRWPSHSRARAALAKAKDRPHPKDFYEREYGIPKRDVVHYATIADRMRGRAPRELTRIMNQLDRLVREHPLNP